MFGWLRRSSPPPTEEQLKLTGFLVSYPPYAPPDYNPAPNDESTRAASFQYREYFLANRQARLEALREFLANFDVCLSLDDAGLMAVSSWLPHWGDLLIDFDDQAVSDAYDRFRVPWTGKLIGLNVMFDLGIYYAECLWSRRTKLKWVVVIRTPDTASHYIDGLPGGKWFDPINFMFSECWSIRQAKKPKPKWVTYSDDPWILRSESFYRHVVSKTPPGRRSRNSKTPNGQVSR